MFSQYVKKFVLEAESLYYYITFYGHILYFIFYFKSCLGKLNLCFIVITKSFGLCSNLVLDHNFLNSLEIASYFLSL